MAEKTKIYLTWDDIHQTVKNTFRGAKKLRDLNELGILTFARGGNIPSHMLLSMFPKAVDITVDDVGNWPPIGMNCSSDMVGLGGTEPPYRQHIIIDDIIDTGETIINFLETVIRSLNTSDDSDFGVDAQTITPLIFVPCAKESGLKRIIKKFPKCTVIAGCVIAEDEWVVFPWENE